MHLRSTARRYDGFERVRMVPAKPGIAFVDFDEDANAATALQGLQGFNVTPEHKMQVTYAKK